MHHISVTRDPDGESGIYPLSIDAINYMECESDKKRIVIHTDHEIYYTMGTIKYWETAINSTSGYRFEKVDRNLLVNLDNIRVLDRKTRNAYFDSVIDKGSQKVGIAYHKYDEHVKRIQLYNPKVTVL